MSAQRVVLNATLNRTERDAEYEITAITPGPANGLVFPESVLRASVEAGQWRGLSSFVDHHTGPGRSVRDLVGVADITMFQDAGARGILRLWPTAPAWIAPTLDRLAESQLAGQPAPKIGFSAVLYVDTDRADRTTVTAIKQVESLDLVWNPARGGRVERVLNQDMGEEGEEEEDMDTVNGNGGQGQADTIEAEVLAAELEQARGILAEVGQVRGMLATLQSLQEQLQAQMLAQTLDVQLAGSGLPAPLQQAVRTSLAGRTYTAADIGTAIEAQRTAYAALQEQGVIRGLGVLPGGRQAALVHGMMTDMDRLQLAVDRLIGVHLPDSVRDVPRLTGIRELYHLLTGDYEMQGVFHSERVTLANVTTTTISAAVANAMNKVVAIRTAAVGRVGYDWWRKIVHEQDFGSLQSISWITVGGFGDLPTVSEGAAYTELTFDDYSEAASWTKKGGYAGVTMEAIDRDDVGVVAMIPIRIATAGIRALSDTVAAIFTQNSGAGPTLSDSVALFHSTSASRGGDGSTAGSGNLSTTALSAAEWDVAIQQIFKRPELNSSKRLGLRPRFLLVPIDLEKTALQIVGNPEDPATTTAEFTNVRRTGYENVVAVPEWTDTNNWAAVVDPIVCPGIGVGYRFGRIPELFVADSETSGLLFTNDTLPIKARFFFAVSVIDWRAMRKYNV